MGGYFSVSISLQKVTQHGNSDFGSVPNRVPASLRKQPAIDDLPAAINLILPHRRERLRCSEVYRAINSSPQHVLNLVRQELLERIPGDLAPKDSPL